MNDREGFTLSSSVYDFADVIPLNSDMWNIVDIDGIDNSNIQATMEKPVDWDDGSSIDIIVDKKTISLKLLVKDNLRDAYAYASKVFRPGQPWYLFYTSKEYKGHPGFSVYIPVVVSNWKANRFTNTKTIIVELVSLCPYWINTKAETWNVPGYTSQARPYEINTKAECETSFTIRKKADGVVNTITRDKDAGYSTLAISVRIPNENRLKPGENIFKNYEYNNLKWVFHIPFTRDENGFADTEVTDFYLFSGNLGLSYVECSYQFGTSKPVKYNLAECFVPEESTMRMYIKSGICIFLEGLSTTIRLEGDFFSSANGVLTNILTLSVNPTYYTFPTNI